ncbi:MAG: hypothetical protein UW27_C0002G0027 [Parcubacteria group bacterium GW2011_GWA1_44_13]|uniref:Glycosyltransferase 2-like domain-containing protein n=1 Tax=Candidatus Nomurabacteria bacterium GW2011_GWB1_44_12 TaxID=1618748 RepID=A0A837IAC1_9BACT|nr:MAG: hypothetical protein UW17_C0017G0009 [Candidatus Nomurabacteria bacterium GW2011_GWD1_44_10]KKT37081.1 MAG: hypothetical protein UW25_C0002G0027 [Candidatus Nomurabacteria bacterium GW2011_GWB1_44_12]KKT38377.1 MAG: hypothetical protein UW27_C0002G0027 [Parcubacteria group bacterium GW2011_GWA1_44_13]KKT60609.1 MAG: Glycosyl transferase family 2 [Parcubacteria group bacterium GW2011_GWC1_44_26]
MKNISIILPTHNGASYIKQSIESVLKQTHQNFELIIINDGSSDNSEEIIKSFLDTRIKYIKNDINLGLQKTLNLGINLAEGEYIARIDDDDFWNDEDKLIKQIELFKTNSKLVLVGTGMHAIDGAGNKKFDLILPETDKKIRGQILSRTSFIHSSVCFPKKAFLEVGGFDESERTKHVEDHDLWLKFGSLGKFHNIPSCSVTVRFHNKSVIGKNFRQQQYREMALIFKYGKYYPNFLQAVARSFLRIIFRMFVKPR